MPIRGRPVHLVCPTAQLDSFTMAKVTPAPGSKLKLEWVYGYRGRDARANLHLLPTGEMTYFVAAVVVLYNVEDQSQRHYLGNFQLLGSIHHSILLLVHCCQASSGVCCPERTVLVSSADQ